MRSDSELINRFHGACDQLEGLDARLTPTGDDEFKYGVRKALGQAMVSQAFALVQTAMRLYEGA